MALCDRVSFFFGQRCNRYKATADAKKVPCIFFFSGKSPQNFFFAFDSGALYCLSEKVLLLNILVTAKEKHKIKGRNKNSPFFAREEISKKVLSSPVFYSLSLLFLLAKK